MEKVKCEPKAFCAIYKVSTVHYISLTARILGNYASENLSLGFHEILCFGHIRSQHDRNENMNLLQIKLILLQNIHLVIQQDQSDLVVLQRRSYFDFLLAKTKYNQTQCHVLQILVLQEETIKQSKRHIVKICYGWF